MTAGAHLPGILCDIAEAAGIEAALAVARARGGCRAYFPEAPRCRSWLVEAVGLDKAAIIGRLFASGKGGIELEVPRGPALSRVSQWREIYRRLAAGQSKAEIARALGISHKTVQAHANGRRPTARYLAEHI